MTAVEFEDPIYGLAAAREIAAKTGGTVLEGPFSAFVLAKDRADLSQRPGGTTVYREAGYRFPGDPNLLKRHQGITEARGKLDDSQRLAPNLETDDPEKLKKLIERESGLVIGSRVEETGSSGVSGQSPDGTAIELYLLPTRPGLLRRSEPVGRVEITTMSRQQLDTERAGGTL